jgi:hypothetical protein
MKWIRLSRVFTALFLLALAAGLSGCTSTAFLGTPLYNGERKTQLAPNKTRVYLWPALYYRDPALSVLWPLFDFTDDHAAVRPFFSVYRLQEDRKEYNVLWPLAQFDRHHEDNRIFPVFWGNNYAAVFPLYWHEDDPFSDTGRGFDTLFPLWLYTHPQPDDYSFYALWPLYNRKHDGATQGWRLWPLYADWELGGGAYYGWYAWPLGQYWGGNDVHNRLLIPLFYQESEPGASTFISLLAGRHNEPEETWSYAVPLYYYERARDRSTGFYSLLGGRHREANGDGYWYATPALAWGSREGKASSTWVGGLLYHAAQSPDASSSFLFPLYYRGSTSHASTFLTLLGGGQQERDGDGFWYATPALAWGSREGEDRSTWIGGPLYHSARYGAFSTSHLFPLYFRKSTPDSSTFLTLLGGRHHDPVQDWSCLFPLWVTRKDAETPTSWYTLLGGRRRESNGDSFWYFTPALAWSWNTGDHSVLLVGGPLFHSYRNADSHTTHLFPLYYYTREVDELLQFSLPWSRYRSPAKSWDLVPPFWFDYEDRAGAFTVTPFYLQGLNKKSGETWSAIPPVYYHRNLGTGDTFLSPLFSRWSDSEGEDSMLVPPALTYSHRSETRTDLWTLAGLGHWSWGREPGSSHLIPLYYHDPVSDTTLSLPYCVWSNEQKTDRSMLIPPALSYYHRSDTRTDLWALAGLGHWSWGKEPGASHLIPLYYRDPVSDTTLSLPYCAWSNEQKTDRSMLIPPALSYYHRSDTRTDLWTLAGLGHWSWGKEPGSSHLLPLYYRNPSSDTTLSLLYSSWGNEARQTGTTLIPPLLSWLEQEPGNRTLHVLLGLGKFNWGPEAEDSYLFPLYYRDPVNDSFLSLPWARWQDGDRSVSAVPLLLSWFSRDRTDRDLRLLLGLYGRSWSTQPDKASSSWLFPLYADNPDYFLTLPAGRWKGGDTLFTYCLTPLAGWRSGETRGSWLLPLYWYRREVASGESRLWYLPWGRYHASGGQSESALFPLYRYENDGPAVESDDPGELSHTRGRAWHVLFLAGYSNQRKPLGLAPSPSAPPAPPPVEWTTHNRLFPLWWYARSLRPDTGRLEKYFDLLIFLQNYERTVDLGPSPEKDYTCTRILWYFLRYERDHDVVEMDIFPGITYDRDASKMRKVSFLWRCFRYERNDDKKAVDLLFLPVWRTSWAE